MVIPNYFDPENFTFQAEKDDYFLFLGRVYAGKGIHIAIQVTEAIGAKLVIAGQNSLADCGYTEIPSHVEVIGYADMETRKKLMAGAKGAFVASLYLEPFGGVMLECMFSGKSPSKLNEKLVSLEECLQWLLGTEWLLTVLAKGKRVYRGTRKIAAAKKAETKAYKSFIEAIDNYVERDFIKKPVKK